MVIKSRIERAIAGASPVKADLNQKKRVQVNVHIPQSLLIQVDECVEKRIGISRTWWILEAIHEKLNKDAEDD